jgi:hypothetical protein
MKLASVRARFLRSLGWSALITVSTATAGTVTLRTVDESDKDACEALRNMVVAADMAHMTDEELCDFRFSRLPPAKTIGFTFPDWKRLSVADPVETFRKAIVDDMRPGKKKLGYATSAMLESVSINSGAGNLSFYTSEVKISGEGSDTTLLLADISSCRNGDVNNEMGAPAVFAFRDRERTSQEPMSPSSWATGGAQVALWKGNIPIRLTNSTSWTKRMPRPGSILSVSLMGWYRRTDEGTPEYIYAYPVCSIALDRRS